MLATWQCVGVHSDANNSDIVAEKGRPLPSNPCIVNGCHMQIMMAHDMWTKLGSSKYDYNLTFTTSSTAAMYDYMPREEQEVLKVSQSYI